MHTFSSLQTIYKKWQHENSSALLNKKKLTFCEARILIFGPHITKAL